MHHRSSFLPASIMLVLAGVLQLAARKCPGFGQWYAAHIYPVIVSVIGRIMGFFPFSVVEFGLYALILLCLVFAVQNIRKPLRVLRGLYCLVSALALVFTLNCGINYYRHPFSYNSGLVIRESSTEELYAMCSYLVDQINTAMKDMDTPVPYESQTPNTPDPGFMDLWNYGTEARTAMARLGREFPELGGFYPRPKPLLLSRILSVQQLCGIYSPFTVEANYNREMPRYNIPHTICHELSHLKGFMREDEANFIGYMACIGSDNARFRYSGYLMGWVYAGNALAKTDMDACLSLQQRLPQEAIADLKYNNSFWARYDGQVAKASSKMNDTYLKMQNQTDGVKSYGRVVDLMLAYYRERLSSGGG